MKKVFKSSLVLSVFFFTSLHAFEGILSKNTNLRESPSLDSRILKVYPKNTSVIVEKKVYTSTRTWYKLSNGYISSELVGDSIVKESFKGIILKDSNLREKPNLNAKVIKVFPKETIVEVEKRVYTKNSGTWYKLKKGYVSSDLISKNSNKINIYSNSSKTSQKTGEILLSHIDEEDIKEVKFIEGEKYHWYKLSSGWVTFPHLKKTNGVILDNFNEKVVVEKKKKEIKKEKVVTIKKQIVKEKDSYKFFTSIQLGYSILNFSKQNKFGSVSLLEKQESASNNISLELGLEYDENIDFSVNYKRVNNNSVTLDNFYALARYKFKQEKLIPYIATNIGYTRLTWDKKPVNTFDNDLVSNSYILGANVGILYPVFTKTNLILDYGLQYMGHKTQIQTSNNDSAEIKHDLLHSFNLGLRYNF